MLGRPNRACSIVLKETHSLSVRVKRLQHHKCFLIDSIFSTTGLQFDVQSRTLTFQIERKLRNN